MSESADIGGYGVPTGFFLAPNQIHVPASPSVPRLAAALAPDVQPPAECDYWRALDCAGGDGLPDLLGNDQYGDCVECAILRAAQAQCPYPRKPTRAEAEALFTRLTGRPPDGLGTATDPALNVIAAQGIDWADQDRWVPRRFVVDHQNMAHVKLAIYAFRAVLLTINVPEDGYVDGAWVTPPDPDKLRGQHEILLTGYEVDGTLRTYTWGRADVTMPLSWYFRYALECNAMVFAPWLVRDNAALDWDRLMAIGGSVG